MDTASAARQDAARQHAVDLAFSLQPVFDIAARLEAAALCVVIKPPRDHAATPLALHEGGRCALLPDSQTALAPLRGTGGRWQRLLPP